MLAYGYSSQAFAASRPIRPASASTSKVRQTGKGSLIIARLVYETRARGWSRGCANLAYLAHAVPLEIVWVRLLHSGHQSRRWLGKINLRLHQEHIKGGTP